MHAFFIIIAQSKKGRGGKAKGRVRLEGMEGREWKVMKDE
jgi:hypothetical protein